MLPNGFDYLFMGIVFMFSIKFGSMLCFEGIIDQSHAYFPGPKLKHACLASVCIKILPGCDHSSGIKRGHCVHLLSVYLGKLLVSQVLYLFEQS